MTAARNIVTLSLWVFCFFSSSTSQRPRFGTPRGCLLNRLDLFPCNIINTGLTDVPDDNEYAIYSTRIRGNNPSSLNCIIRSRDDIVLTMDTVGGDPRVYYLFSPGREQANPRRYGNQQLVRYRVQCEPNHFAFFNLTFLELQEPSCMDPNFPQPRCVDYLRLSRGGGNFGFSETCGNTIPPEFNSQLDTGTIEVTLRTSDRGRYPGFIATVVCVNTQLLPQTGNSTGGDQGGPSPRVQFEARVRRHTEYVHRMRRSAPSLEEARSLACSVEEVNVPFNGGIIYTDRVVSIVDMATMAVIRRLPSPINKLVVMDTNGTQLEFIREVPLTNDSVTVFSGPGPLTRAGVIVFFTSFTTIPEIGDTPPELVVPQEREADITGILLAAHLRLNLEQNEELLTMEQLEPPPFDLMALGLVNASDATPPLGDARVSRRATHEQLQVRRHRVKRITRGLEPVQCNYTDDIIGLAILNDRTINPVLLTIISVIMNCTEREQPGRIEQIIQSVAIDFQFTQQEYLVREDEGFVTVCLDIATDGFLPRDIVVSLVTEDSNATAPSDYTFVNTTSIFLNGTTRGGPGSQMCMDIGIVNDSLVEFDEVFLVTADSPDPNVNTTSITATIIIMDNEFMFQITGSPNSFSVSEDGGLLAPPITVMLVLGTLPFDVEIVLNSEGTASIDGGDFEISDSSLTFESGSAPGASLATSVTVLEDSLVEEMMESVIVRLSTTPLARLAFPPRQDSVRGNITDNDVPMFQLTPTNVTLEESTAVVSFDVELIQSILTFPITIAIQDVTQTANVFGIDLPSDNLATSGADYVSFGTSLVFPAESAPGAVLSFNVTVLQDNVIESDETVVIAATILLRGLFTSGDSISMATIHILDNEADTVLCPALPDPENGMIVYSSVEPAPFQFGTEARYVCDPTFGLEGGDTVRVCRGATINSVGEWDGMAPECNAITCPPLSDPPNGMVTYNSASFGFGTVAVYSCDAGFFLTGGPPRVCGGDGSSSVGEFDGESSSCEPILCPALTAPDNGVVSYSSRVFFGVGTTATHSCDAGFSLAGNVVLVCENGASMNGIGEWNGDSPTCIPIECPALSPLDNGQIVYIDDQIEPFSLGTVAFHSCDEGFFLEGIDNRLCDGSGSSAVGEWTGDSPICSAITCRPAMELENGLIAYSDDPDPQGNYTFGTLVLYDCDFGFFLVGDLYRICGEGVGTVGEYDGMAPFCEEIRCSELPGFPNGTISYDTAPNSDGQFQLGTIATISCFPDFFIIGAPNRSCVVSPAVSSEGVFDGEESACVFQDTVLASVDQELYLVREDAGSVEVQFFVLTMAGSVSIDTDTAILPVNATEDLDFSLHDSSFSQVSPDSAMLSFIFNITDDNIVEFDEVFQIVLFVGEFNIFTTVVVMDNDITITFPFGVPIFTVAENGGIGPTPILLEAFDLPGFPVTIYFSSTGSATEGEDFTVEPVLLVDQGGEGDVGEVALEIVNDELVENVEMILLQPFSDPIGRLAFTPDDIIQVTILDDDVPLFSVIPTEAAVNESNVIIATTIQLVQGILNSPINFIINTQSFRAPGSACVSDTVTPVDPTTLVPPNLLCPRGTIYCGDSGEPASNVSCVPAVQFCDGNTDCPNEVDESTPVCEICPPGLIACPADPENCFNGSLICDGQADCPNGGDELVEVCGCPNEGEFPLCQFSDGSAECVSVERVCDSVLDCENGADESESVCGTSVIGSLCPRGSIPLCPGNSSCFSFSQLCDGTLDCAQGADEDFFACGNCETNQLMCPGENGRCISNIQLCDGIFDCPGGVDETLPFCGNAQVPVNSFDCSDQSSCFIPSVFVCDGLEDCPSGRDEENCPTPLCPNVGPNVPVPFPQLVFCPGGTIYCQDGGPASSLNCVPIGQYCDGEPNCPNGLDESVDFCGNCPVGEIQCPGDPTLTCVSNTLSCNGVVDCPNGVDESPDACGCPQGELPLCRLADLDSECLSIELICDGVQDCEDGTDESLEACGMRAGVTLLCPPGMSQCNGELCLEFERFCDGVPDCPGGTDESTLACGDCAVGTGPCLFDPQNTCVNTSAVCDGVRDCPNGMDESNLYCRGAFRCDTGSDCYISFDLVCNGFEDCPNGRDEQDCGKLLVFPAGASPGETVLFNITVVDDNTPIGDQLITTNITVSPPGEFTTGGRVTTATLLVIEDDFLPVITSQPLSQAIVVGGMAAFSVIVLEEGVTYQWFLTGFPLEALVDSVQGGILGANTSMLTLSFPFTDNADQGSDTFPLFVRVSNAVGYIDSSTAFLTLINFPVFITQPNSLQVVPGENTLLVAAASGVDLVYQWLHNDSLISDIPGKIEGTDTNVLRIFDIELVDTGVYQLRVSNLAGSVLSDAITLSLACPGVFTQFPASSCQQILECNAALPSGLYWISTVQGSTESRFCDMTRTCGGVTGGWMRVAALDMRERTAQCPTGLVEAEHSGQRLCTKNFPEICSQVFFETGVTYDQVCGMIIGYQFGSPDTFEPTLNPESSIDQIYVEGISLTYGSNPRQHIWTFAAGLDEVASIPSLNCPCTNVETASQATPPPDFVGNDYFCDTGAGEGFANNFFYGLDPLWDGAGCGEFNACCSLNNPPWFFKQLPTLTDAIEMRVCTGSDMFDEQVLVEQIEMYVRLS